MDDSWDRRRRSEFEAAESSVREVLRAYGLDDRSVIVARPESALGYSGAIVLQVKCGADACCLRRWPSEGISATRIRELHHLLHWLRSRGVNEVPVPDATLSGETLVTAGGAWWQLEPWMPGVADFRDSPTDARLRSAMRGLAKWHLAAACYDCRPEGREWFARRVDVSPAVIERLARIHHWSEPTCDAAVRNSAVGPASDFQQLSVEILNLYRMSRLAVQRELQSLRAVRVVLHPCLRDVWHDHLLFTGEELTGLIDPAAMRTECVAADLSRLLGSLLMDDRPRWDFALAAYSEVRPLTADERRLLPVLDRSGVLLSGLTWIDRRLDGNLADEDIPRVVSRLQTIAERMRRLSTVTA